MAIAPMSGSYGPALIQNSELSIDAVLARGIDLKKRRLHSTRRG